MKVQVDYDYLVNLRKHAINLNAFVDIVMEWAESANGEIQQLQARIKELENPWISCDEPPKNHIPVLLYFPTEAVRTGVYVESVGYHSYGYSQDWKIEPIYWQTIKPPTGDNNE